MTVPGFADLKIPPSAVRTSSTCAVAGKAVTTKSTSFTVSATDPQYVIPASLQNYSVYGLISCPLTAKPALRRFLLINLPMQPRPMKATSGYFVAAVLNARRPTNDVYLENIIKSNKI